MQLKLSTLVKKVKTMMDDTFLKQLLFLKLMEKRDHLEDLARYGLDS